MFNISFIMTSINFVVLTRSFIVAEKYMTTVDLQATLQAVKTEYKSIISKSLKDYADSFNLSTEDALQEIFSNQIDLIKGTSKIKVKYRNPFNFENEWAGRGRIPKWMEPYLAYEKIKITKDDFLIERLDHFPLDAPLEEST